MLIGQAAGMIGDPHLDIVYLWVVILFHGEAKQKAMTLVLCEMIWLKSLLKEFQVLKNETMLLHCDNAAAINITNNLVQFDRMKHMD